MMHHRFTVLFSAFALVVLFSLTGCDPEKDDVRTDPPVDSDPVVTLLTPTNGYALAKRGETVNMTFELHDNELLTSFEGTEEWTSVSGQQALAETRITGEYAVLSTTNSVQTISYTVPQGVQVYTTIKVRVYATDNKGKIAIAMFRINVIPDVNDPVIYEIQSYNDDSLYSITTGRDYNFDLLQRRTGNDGQIPGPNRYLREASVPPAIDHILTSPIWSTTDSVLVVTNTSMFNFEELTYKTMYEAFVTSNRINNKTDPLNANDIVILKMPNLPHFAAIKVKSTEGQAGCGCMLFDYKYSYQ